MLRNYFTIAIRNLLRQKIYTLINVLGLAIGIAFCLLTFLYVRYEWSYDTFHEDADSIYLVGKQVEGTGNPRKIGTTTSRLLRDVLLEQYPEVEQAVRIDDGDITKGTDVRYGDKLFFDQSGLFADPSFFEVFSFSRVAGELETALDELNSVVMSREMAYRFFGNEDPLGRNVSIRTGEETEEFVVTGVVVVPGNSNIQFDFLLSFEKRLKELSKRGSGNVSWFAWNFFTFIKLPARVQPIEFEQKLPALVETYLGEWIQKKRKRIEAYDLQLKLFPLTGIHLNPRLYFPIVPTSNPVYSYILSGIALSVLLIACVNFMNLSLGLSSTRFKEVGMRKVLGARRWQLAKQFWGEAILLSLLALFLGIALTELALPVFNSLVYKQLVMDYGSTWLTLLGLVLGVGLVTGSYPALVLSGFHPVTVMKGTLRFGGSNWFTRGLIVLQFALSTILVVATLLMSEQMAFLRARDLGFDGEQVVAIDTGGWMLGLQKNERVRLLEVYRQAASQYGDIIHVSASNMSFEKGDNGTSGEYQGRDISCRTYSVEYDYLETLGIELKEGRTFSRDFPADEQESILVNEAMVRIFDWDTPLGKKVPILSGMLPLGNKRIIGVVRNFHRQGLDRRIQPASFDLEPGGGYLRYLFIKVHPEDLPSTLSLLKEKWEQVVADRPFVFSFLDEDVERSFRASERWVRIIRYATLFAVFVACLGAFGLASLMVARRTKEVGIRKILGATTGHIVSLLSREFVRLVAIASLVAWPVAFYGMREWLQDFAYRIDMGPVTFVAGGMLTLAVVLLTVSIQAVKAALANPVDALRYE